MSRLCALCLALLSTLPLSAIAQQAEVAAADTVSRNSPEAKRFDFLLGQWQVEVHPKVSGLVAMMHGTPKLVGTWSVHRTADGTAIEDELNVVDTSGNPISSLTSTRTFVAAEGRWKVTGNDSHRSRKSDAVGTWKDGEMVLEGRFVDADGKITLTRTRFFEIGAAAFRVRQDRSTDNGQTWDEEAQTMEAKRVSPAPSR